MAMIFYRLGVMLRESGQALDRLGCQLQGKGSYAEDVFRHAPIVSLAGRKPDVAPSAFVAPSASLLGSVEVGPNSSVWYGSILRGDAGRITIGSNSNVQDGTVVRTHQTRLGPGVLPGAHPDTTIGSNVTIGHQASLHGVTIEDEVLIGMGATLLEGVKVERGAIVAAGAVVGPDTVAPTGQLWGGAPAKYMRDVKPNEKEYIPTVAKSYTQLGAPHSKLVPKSIDDVADAALAQLKA